MSKFVFFSTNILLKATKALSNARPYTVRHMCSSKSHSQQDEPPLYDVIVSGGGMVGAAMAGALGHDPMFEDKKILLLEGGPEKQYTVPDKFGSRTCALSPATRQLLESIGAWDEIVKMRFQPVKRMQVWDSCSDAMIAFQNDDLMEDLSYIVENDIILAAIMSGVKSCSDNVEVRYNSKAKAYTFPKAEGGSEEHSAWSQVHLDGGTTLNTKLLIGADGFKSLVRQCADIGTVGWDYNQFGVVATVRLSEPTENNVAWQRFLKTGPIALLPLSEHFSCLIWSTETEDAKNLLRLEPESFVDAVNHAFWSDSKKDAVADYAGKVLDNILVQVGLDGSSSQQLPPTIVSVDEGSRAAFPLGVGHANNYVKPRMALIGDSAHRIHPMAGQGVNLGFGDVACLRDVLADALYNGSDIGSIDPLLEYESIRQRHVVPTLAGVDGLQKLYGTDWSPVVLLRTLGLQATNAISPIKGMFMRHATK